MSLLPIRRLHSKTYQSIINSKIIPKEFFTKLRLRFYLFLSSIRIEGLIRTELETRESSELKCLCFIEFLYTFFL